MTAIVWSKEKCPGCVQAKNLLTTKNIMFEERIIGVNWTKEDLLKEIPTASTVPQIVLNNKLIGGLPELQTHLKVNYANQ
jgi:glutaredoxin 3